MKRAGLKFKVVWWMKQNSCPGNIKSVITWCDKALAIDRHNKAMIEMKVKSLQVRKCIGRSDIFYSIHETVAERRNRSNFEF